LKRVNIDIAVKDGEATLSGAVPSSAAQLKAYKLAESAAGVKKVNDQMTVGTAHASVAKPRPRAASSAAPPAPGEQPSTMVIPVGTTISIRTIDGIDSSVNRTGQSFKASLDAPIMVDGEVVVPRGVDVTLLLAEAKQAGKMT